MTAADWSSAIEPLGPGYRSILDRGAKALLADGRVLALFLSGSVGRRVADASSDLDLLLFVREEAIQPLLDTPTELIASVVGPTILSRRMPFGFTTITPAWERVDLMIAAASSAERFRRDDVVEVFDRAGVKDILSTAGRPTMRDARAVSFLSEEFLRVLGLLEVVLSREEYLVGVEGAGLLRGHLRGPARPRVELSDGERQALEPAAG